MSKGACSCGVALDENMECPLCNAKPDIAKRFTDLLEIAKGIYKDLDLLTRCKDSTCAGCQEDAELMREKIKTFCEENGVKLNE